MALNIDISNLNKVFDSRVRLGIMSALMVNAEINYNDLKELLQLTDGNLATKPPSRKFQQEFRFPWHILGYFLREHMPQQHRFVVAGPAHSSSPGELSIAGQTNSAFDTGSDYMQGTQMAVSPEFDRLAQFVRLTDRMIEDATREQLVDALELLAAHVGHYQRRYGTLPLDEAIDLLEAETLTDEQAGWVADGLENVAVAIATVSGEEEGPPRQH